MVNDKPFLGGREAFVCAAYTEYIDAHSSMEGAQDRMQGGAGEVDVVSEGGRKSESGRNDGGRQGGMEAGRLGGTAGWGGEGSGLVEFHTHAQ